VQAERRLERSRNATTAAVPLTEANATAFSILCRDERTLSAAQRALVASTKFNGIKHHSTRFNISHSCRWNRPAKSHPGKRKGTAKKRKLVKARVTPYFNKVFAARQNLADCCAKCFACANRIVASFANPVISPCC
jgi:hypothetical protein